MLDPKDRGLRGLTRSQLSLELIRGLRGIDGEHLVAELERGARFMVYEYCVSLLFVTYRKSSSVHFIPSDTSRLWYEWGYSLISLLFGWWGFPWGPIFTIATVIKNLSGGTDVTAEVLTSLNELAAEHSSQRE